MASAPDDELPDVDVGDESTFLLGLRKVYGAGVDPRVDLRDDEGAGASATRLKRLAESGTHARYVLKGEVGRGGMGAVLRVFDRDLRRNLAMKVILGAEGGTSAGSTAVDPESLGRFLEEAQVTGQLDHPGVVPVHELGVDAEGRVYFTMRLVRGRDLKEIFGLVRDEADGWTLTRAAGVLLKVCETMAYAHDKGVVHRDLKPANVMVGKYGEVYVMDWGLARVEGHADNRNLRLEPSIASLSQVQTDRKESRTSDVDSPLITMDGTVMGTPAYMPPEQARGEVDSVDQRSDVYSVGAMLYQLLTGRIPFVPEGARVSPRTLLMRVLEGPPTPVYQVAAGVSTELEAICEKAMARDPAERYGDMGALAQDLRNFLEGRVVQAFETGATAEFKKWVQRNKGMAASILAAILLALGGLGATSYVQASSNRRLTRQSAITEAVNDFLNEDLLAAVAPSARAGQGRDVRLREVLDLAAERIEDAAEPGGRFADKPVVEAAIRRTLGTTYWLLGEYEPAAHHLERAVLLATGSLGDEDPETLLCMQNLGSVYQSQGRYAEAEPLALATLERRKRVLGDEHQDTLGSMNNLALLHLNQGHPERAEPLFLETLEIRRRTFGDDHKDTISSVNNLSVYFLRQGRVEEAEALILEGVERAKRTEGEHSPGSLTLMTNLASVYMSQGRDEKATEVFSESLAGRKRVLGDEHPDTLRTMKNLATMLERLGRVEEAERLFDETLETQRRVLAPDHVHTLGTMNDLANLYARSGRFADSIELHSETLAGRRVALGDGHPETLASMNNLAWILTVAEPEALIDVERALALAQEAAERTNRENPGYLETLAGAHALAGDVERAAEVVREMISLLPPGDAPERTELEKRLAEFEETTATDR